MQPHQDRAPRRLTHDERKAAEAAFQGWAFNEAWSQAALNVYNGIRLAQMKRNHERLISWSGDAESHLVGDTRVLEGENYAIPY